MQQLVERAQRSGVGVVRVHNIRGKIAQPLPHPAQQQRVGRAPARQAQNGQTFITQQLRQLSRTRTGHQRLHVGCAGQRAGPDNTPAAGRPRSSSPRSNNRTRILVFHPSSFCCRPTAATFRARRTPSAFIHNVKADFSAEPAAPNSNRPSNERPPSGLPTSRKSLEGKEEGGWGRGTFLEKGPPSPTPNS